MYATHPHDHNSPSPVRRFLRAFNALIDSSVDLLQRLGGARQTGIKTYIPKRMARDIMLAEARVNRARIWLFALLDLFNGDRTYLPPPGAPAPTPRPTRGPANATRDPAPLLDPCWTDRDSEAAVTRRIRRAFATVPVNVIARGLARTLGIRLDSDYFPTELLGITETPLAWADRVYTPALPTPPAPPPPAPPRADTDPPPLHRPVPPRPSG